MIREDAAQHYAISRATWGFSEPAPYYVPVLCLAIETVEQPSIFSEEKARRRQPRWNLDIWMPGLSDKMIVPGSQFSISECYDDHTGIIFTMFHYTESEGTEPNVIKITGRENDFLDLSIEGFVRDAHASIPPTRITVDARFTRLTPHPEISAQFGGRENLPSHQPPCGAIYSPPKTPKS
jgi:hypothetical protein